MEHHVKEKPSRSHRDTIKVAILYGAIAPDAPTDEQDVLEEVGGVAGVLTRPGLSQVAVPLTLDFRKAAATLRKIKPAVVFNLVESLEGSGRLIHLACALLDHLGLPYTGAPTEAMFVTSNKVLAKRAMAAAGIPTMPWLEEAAIGAGEIPFAAPYILKSVWEHASIGVHETSVVPDRDALVREVGNRRDSTGNGLYAEPYLDGREFNIAILGGAGEPEVLPPSEILFTDYPAGKPRIVDYKAKWVEDSFEYENTPRNFEFAEADTPLLEQLKEISLACCRLFGLRGYARVDFRVDTAGRPWVMEVNANPCINPESGFVYTAGQLGMDYSEIIERIIRDSLPGFSLSR
jgi:D-alanine-D-alanine ligase